MKSLFLAFALFAAQSDVSLLDDGKETEALALMKDIRCLVCQNQSIIDSNAEIAGDLRQFVRDRVAAGDDGPAIKAQLVSRFGDWVLLEPPIDPRTYLLWASPLLFLLIGAVFYGRRRRSALAPAPLSAEEKARLEAMIGPRDKDGDA